MSVYFTVCSDKASVLDGSAASNALQLSQVKSLPPAPASIYGGVTVNGNIAAKSLVLLLKFCRFPRLNKSITSRLAVFMQVHLEGKALFPAITLVNIKGLNAIECLLGNAQGIS